jgi:hypothetical protein
MHIIVARERGEASCWAGRNLSGARVSCEVRDERRLTLSWDNFWAKLESKAMITLAHCTACIFARVQSRPSHAAGENLRCTTGELLSLSVDYTRTSVCLFRFIFSLFASQCLVRLILLRQLLIAAFWREKKERANPHPGGRIKHLFSFFILFLWAWKRGSGTNFAWAWKEEGSNQARTARCQNAPIFNVFLAKFCDS